MLLPDLAYFFIAIVVLVISGYWLVNSLSKIASFLKISEFVLGFIFMAISTSLPELFIGIKSALLKSPSLSFGNVIGANVLNLTVAIGIPIIIARHIAIKSRASRKDAVLKKPFAGKKWLCKGFKRQDHKNTSSLSHCSFHGKPWLAVQKR